MKKLDEILSWIENKGLSDTSNSDAINYHAFLSKIISHVPDDVIINELDNFFVENRVDSWFYWRNGFADRKREGAHHNELFTAIITSTVKIAHSLTNPVVFKNSRSKPTAAKYFFINHTTLVNSIFWKKFTCKRVSACDILALTKYKIISCSYYVCLISAVGTINAHKYKKSLLKFLQLYHLWILCTLFNISILLNQCHYLG